MPNRRVFVRRPNGVLKLEGQIVIAETDPIPSPVTLDDGTTYWFERATDTYVLYREIDLPKPPHIEVL